MLINVLIPMRAGSKRLPSKHFFEIEGKPIYEIIFTNVKTIFPNDAICFCIPDTPENDLYEDKLKELGARVFRGDEKNVLGRLQDAARKTHSHYVARLCGDNIFLLEDLIKEILGSAKLKEYKVITNAKQRSFPQGCTFEAIERKTFLSINSDDLSCYDKEHVFPYFYDTVPEVDTKNILFDKNINHFNLTVDDPNQIRILRKVYREIQGKTVIDKYSITRICDILEQAKKDVFFEGKTGKYTVLNLGKIPFQHEVKLISKVTMEVRKLGLDALEFRAEGKMTLTEINGFVRDCRKLLGNEIAIGIEVLTLDDASMFSSVADFVSMRIDNQAKIKLMRVPSSLDCPFMLNLSASVFSCVNTSLINNDKYFINVDCNQILDPSDFVDLKLMNMPILKNIGATIKLPVASKAWLRFGKSVNRVRLAADGGLDDQKKVESATQAMAEILNSNIQEFRVKCLRS